MPVPPAPTAEQTQDLHYKLARDWSPRFQIDRDLEDVLTGRNQIETLDMMAERNITPVEIHTGRTGGILEHAKGLLMAPPSWKVAPRGLGPEHELLAEMAERACAKMFEQQFLANGFWDRVARGVLKRGAFVKALPLTAAWTPQAGYPVFRPSQETAKEYLARVDNWKATDAKFPFIIQHIPLLNILPLLSADDQVMASLEEKYVMAGILAEDLGSDLVRGLIARGEVKWYDQLPVVEYIDSHWVQYYLTSRTPITGEQVRMMDSIETTRTYEVLHQFEHGLGKCPVVHIPGLVTDSSLYADRFKSFFDDALESLERYDWLISRLATMVWAHYLPSYTWKITESSVNYKGKERPKLKVKLGGVTALYQDEDLQPLPQPQNLPPADLLMVQLDDMIQRHTLEDVLFGRVIGSAPAYQVNLRINVARSKLTTFAQNMANGISQVMDLMFRGVESLGESVFIDGEELTVPAAKAAQGRVTARIQPKTQFDKNTDIGAAKAALEIGLPWKWTMENIVDITNPAELKLERLAEDLEKLEPVQARLMQEILEDMDLMIENEEFVDAGQLGAAGAPEELLAALESLQTGTEGLGRGPFPPGMAPQTVGGGRGLQTEKAQPQPTTPGIPTGESLIQG